MSYVRPTKEAARGQWKSILEHLGMDASFLNGRNGPCPICGGKDRWRWVNDDGQGGGICGQCGGKATGFILLQQWKGIEWPEAARMVDGVLGNERVTADKPPRVLTEDERRQRCREVVAMTQPVQAGDPVDRYLTARGVGQVIYPKALRTALALPYGQQTHPAMVAVVSRVDGTNATLHRTYLADAAKLDAADCRKMMPGEIPDGACVRLSDWTGSGTLGIAEGIETALAASRLFEVPVWAALNTAMMRNWEPPEGCEEVVVFADNDANFAGHAAAYHLANKLRTRPQWKHIEVSVQVPALPGTDWNDELRNRA